MKKIIILMLIVVTLISTYVIITYNNTKWEMDTQYTMRYTSNRLIVNMKYIELKNSNKFLYDGYSLITPILDTKVCYFVTKESGYLELQILDDCISYNEQIEMVHYNDLLNNGNEKIELNINPEDIKVI
ncbi:hypothetical protein R2F61_09220 [Mollicutes bacterium LVI A0078]|nr:hypothetical protein RZE84_08995 [Mollicutes bacterium LVI A0075]WOO90878.1 hypothetical protein R2F61_09220 [Mollicutes bacterium LVI A0078]